VFALIFTASALALDIGEVPNPRDAGGWVSDTAEVLDAGAESRLNARLDALHADLDVEVALVTVHEVPGAPKAFATELFNAWGVGDAQANNGLLVLLVMGQRRLEMEVGYGLEPQLPDGWLGGMQTRHMVPRFKTGDFGGGLEAGVEQVDARLRRDPAAAREGGGPTTAPGGGGEAAEVGVIAAVVGLVAAFLPVGVAVGGLALLLFLWLRYQKKQRTCPTCQIEMRALSEVEDDEFLSAGERAEERLGSVNYIVYECGQCEFMRTRKDAKLFTRYSRCAACRFKTLRTSRETLVAATRSRGGQVRITVDCQHCSHHDVSIRRTPKLPKPSSSSSSGGGFSSGGRSSGGRSGGSSFGGGRSGGGGAGSSW